MGHPWRGKTVLITGAASGIGRALAGEMIARGARVWLADISESVAQVADQLGMNAKPLVFNVADLQLWQNAVDTVIEQDHHIDYLFNNAGIGFGCDSLHLSAEHYDRYIDVNIRGVTNGIALVYPLMAERGQGCIVNTASMGGLMPSALMSPYAMTKHAVVGLSESLRLEAQYKGVNVITLCPGSVNTAIFDSTGLTGLPVKKSIDLRSYAREKETSISPQEFATKALNDIEKNKTIIIYPKLMKILIWIYRYWPSLYIKLTKKNLEQELERLNAQ
ncbi:MAG: SDR family oxidoreductase [Pseudomonadales bacterium]|nr:SDR family oxidoreductase [Pseudomonadales bacterium]